MAFPFPTFTTPFHSTVYPSISPTNPSLSAAKKTILITGGGSGIGKAIAIAFATAGARAVIILGRSSSTLSAASGEISAAATASGHVTAVKSFVADIRDATAVSNAVKSVREEFGGIDVFVANAGDLYMSTIENAVAEDWWRSFETNVKGTLNCMQSFVHHGLKPAAEGALPPTFINVATIAAHIPPGFGMSAYSSSKLATWKMAAYLDAEMGDRLRVFTIHPGNVATAMSDKAGTPQLDDATLPGGFCAWLAATPEADFLRGRFISVNWDVEELLRRKSEIVEKNMLSMELSGWGA
ncbi:NAD(P)-binding protein [Lophium mytilinum]|uniref:NAD(P)-binding protein n=1 Tax=Lophium mytilinum TaxID=390894 RepID=A0A6A6QGU2_9PEZI|nr:NAD(P)-binding protein [Lophium mytilinum]